VTGNKDNKTKNVIEFDLRELLRIFIKRKWLFVGIFIAILLGGILLSIFRVPQYSLSSSIGITESFFYYNDYTCKFFPEEASELWVFPKNQENVLGNRRLARVGEEIESDEFLEEVSKELDYGVSKNELKKAVNREIDTGDRTLTLITIYKERENTLRMNEEIIDLYISKNSLRLNEVREDLISKIETKLISIKTEIDSLSKNTNKDEEEFVVREINSNYANYEDLDEIRNILIENKEFFIDRIKILEEPKNSNIKEITNLRRDIIISFFSALIIGLMVIFIVNYFRPYKNNQ